MAAGRVESYEEFLRHDGMFARVTRSLWLIETESVLECKLVSLSSIRSQFIAPALDKSNVSVPEPKVCSQIQARQFQETRESFSGLELNFYYLISRMKRAYNIAALYLVT
jgi:hypothetical protein